MAQIKSELKVEYNSVEFLLERREMMQWWADYLGEMARDSKNQFDSVNNLKLMKSILRFFQQKDAIK
jgi:hypothetical protein